MPFQLHVGYFVLIEKKIVPYTAMAVKGGSQGPSGLASSVSVGGLLRPVLAAIIPFHGIQTSHQHRPSCFENVLLCLDGNGEIFNTRVFKLECALLLEIRRVHLAIRSASIFRRVLLAVRSALSIA